MEGGLLSLKWNNHRSTFLQVLSTVRHKESYSDVTIACDGKFYPVHKLVLSTCSEYFEQMFERTNCKHPIIVLKDIKKDDLEALLNYMYVGEVNVLQNNLSGLIKAAEGLRIKGLAVPDESPSEPESQDSKRSMAWGGDEPDAKRRRQDETPATSPRPPAEKSVRERSPASYRDAYRTTFRNRDPISPAPVTPSPETHPPPAAPDPPPDLPPPPTPSLVPPNADVGGTEPVRPPEHEVKVDEALVKEEPHENYTEAEESKEGLGGDAEGLNYTHTTTAGGLETTTGPGRFSPGLRPAAQPQTLEDLVALPGASGLQGKPLWEGDRALLGIPFESYTSNQPPRASQMGPRSSNPSELLGQTLARAIQSAHVCPICGHLARQRKDLKKHLRVHTGEKPYACPICPYRSTQNSNLKTHMRRLHTQAVLPESSRPTSTQAQTTTTPVACPPLYVD